MGTDLLLQPLFEEQHFLALWLWLYFLASEVAAWYKPGHPETNPDGRLKSGLVTLGQIHRD